MKKTVALALCVCLMLCAAGCAEQGMQAEYMKLQTSFFGTFDTIITLMGYAKSEDTFAEVAQEVRAMFQRYHEVFDNYNAYDGVKNLYYLNAQGPSGEAVPVEPELIDLLLFCQENQPAAEGMVNVAMGAVLNLWHVYREEGSGDPDGAELPPMEKLQAAVAHTNFEDVLIDENAGTVQFLDTQLRLDVGAVAKGYAAERVGQWLLTSEMPSFLLSAGGNMRAGEAPMDGRKRWGVAVQEPDGNVFSSAEEDRLDVLFVVGQSVVTSGDYQRYYWVDGRRYHHLISPETLMPPDEFRAVTVVCEDSGMADLLSTAFFLLPYAQGRALADSMEGVAVMWVLNDGNQTVVMTEGMKAMSYNEGATSGRDE